MNEPSPGTDEAIKAGCTCPVLDNHRGGGFMGIKGVYVYSGNCPVHKPTEPNPCKTQSSASLPKSS